MTHRQKDLIKQMLKIFKDCEIKRKKDCKKMVDLVASTGLMNNRIEYYNNIKYSTIKILPPLYPIDEIEGLFDTYSTQSPKIIFNTIFDNIVTNARGDCTFKTDEKKVN